MARNQVIRIDFGNNIGKHCLVVDVYLNNLTDSGMRRAQENETRGIY